MYHNPVLLNECISGLNINPSGTYVDVTYGGGGHSKEIFKLISDGRLIAFDQDKDAVNNKLEDDKFTLINHNFQFLKNFLRLHDATKVDGILADLGVSSHQFDVPERGFSTRFESPLDMRMNQGQTKTAADVVNTYSESDISDVLNNYGEINNYRCFVKGIIEYRKKNKISTTSDLIGSVSRFYPQHKKNKFLAQLFQALRIEVNNEMDVLKSLLTQATESLKSGGRLVVISYHSLEDRIVKNFIKSGNFEGKVEKDFYGNPIVEYKQITRKPIMPEEMEINENNRARSAKLRIAEKL